MFIKTVVFCFVLKSTSLFLHRQIEEDAEMAVRIAAENTRQVMFEKKARTDADKRSKQEGLGRQMAEQRAREAEWALEKAEKLLQVSALFM